MEAMIKELTKDKKNKDGDNDDEPLEPVHSKDMKPPLSSVEGMSS